MQVWFTDYISLYPTTIYMLYFVSNTGVCIFYLFYFRARIKDACDVMRKLVPGMSDKTDKATVFEFAARYIHYLKNFVGSKHDKVRTTSGNI